MATMIDQNPKMRFALWHAAHRIWYALTNHGRYSSEAAKARVYARLDGQDVKTPVGMGTITRVSKFLLLRALRAATAKHS